MASRSSFMIKKAIGILKREFQEKVTIKTLTAETVDSNSKRVQTFTSTAAKAVVSNLDTEYLMQPFADLRAGETAFLFDNEVVLTDRDRITHSSIDYVLSRVEPVDADGQVLGYVAYGKRID